MSIKWEIKKGCPTFGTALPGIGKKLELLGKKDLINDVDHTIAGFDIRGNDVGGAAVLVGKNAAALEDESTLQGADPWGAQNGGRVTISAENMIEKNLGYESLVAQYLIRRQTKLVKIGEECPKIIGSKCPLFRDIRVQWDLLSFR